MNATAGVYTWVGDTDTYIQRSAGNEITIKTGASNALVLDSSQNATFAGNVLAPTFLAGQSAQYNPTGGCTTKATLTANAASRTQLVISNQTNNASASAALVLATYGHDFFVKGGSLAGGSKLTLGFNTNNFLELTSSSATFAGSVTATDGTLTGDLTVSGEVEFSALNSASASPFVVSDGGTLGTRTAAQVLDDIGGRVTKKISGDGSATTFTVTHSFGTPHVMTQLLDYGDNGTGATYEVVQTTVKRNSDNAIDVLFGVAPTSSEDYLVLITKMPAIS